MNFGFISDFGLELVIFVFREEVSSGGSRFRVLRFFFIGIVGFFLFFIVGLGV